MNYYFIYNIVPSTDTRPYQSPLDTRPGIIINYSLSSITVISY